MKLALLIIPALIFLIVGAVFLNSKPTPTNIPTPIPTNTPTPTQTLEPASTPIPTNTPTPTQTLEPASTPFPTKPAVKTQLLSASYGPPLGFYPTEFKVKAGLPVRLEVYATENGIGCMGSIAVPDFSNDAYDFIKGKFNIFEFTPATPGQYPIACAMGIPHGFIIVE